jgi:heptaprenyl diphosphate synthase
VSHSDPARHRDRLIAGFAGIAILIHLLESGIPSPIPGIKPGLANVITLVVLARYGLGMAIWVNGLRVLVSSLLVGSFLAPGFWLSAAGAGFSLAALTLGVAWNHLMPRGRLSVMGLSLLSSVAHIGGQFLLAWGWFVPHPGLLHLLPPLLTAALLLGLVTGGIARALLARLPETPGTATLPP